MNNYRNLTERMEALNEAKRNDYLSHWDMSRTERKCHHWDLDY